MGEKLYKPILRDGDHLVKSKKNEGRIRGISQDENNKTTDIIEWEEVEIEDQTYDYKDEEYSFQNAELNTEQSQIAKMIGMMVVAGGIIYGAGKVNKHIVQPWWRSNAQPWFNNKIVNIKQKFFQIWL